MNLKYEYRMCLQFSHPVTDHHFSLMCIPGDTNRQTIIQNEIIISGGAGYSTCTDGFGNNKIYGCLRDEHSSFEVTVRGEALTSTSEEAYDDPSSIELFRFKVPTRYTVPGPLIKELYERWIIDAPGDDYGKVLHFGNCVQEALNYVSSSTDVSTTAEEALSIGSGVCQDYSHLLISLLRMAGIPARYVVGMMVGEGESHAWVEANCNGYWYGIDATNNLLVNENYIKFSHGRDYEDCMISRGVFTNPYAVQTMNVSVVVTPRNP